MNTRTPLAPPAIPTPTPIAKPEGSAGLDEDLRRFSQLSPMEQLERLEADSLRVNEREIAMRAAEAIISIGQQKPNEYRAPKLSEHDAEVQHQQAQAQRLK